MNKILFVSDECIYPANSGGRIVRFDRITSLAKNNEVHLLVVVKKSQIKEMNGCPLYDCCKSITVVPRENIVISLFKSLFIPFRVASKTGKKVRKAFDYILQKHDINVIVFEEPCVAALGKNVEKPQIIDSDNVEFEALLSHSRSINNPLKKLAFYHEYKLMKKFESKIYNSNHIVGCTFISPDDMKRYEELFELSKKKRCILINHGFRVKKTYSSEKEENNIISFTASMDYLPNEIAAAWLATKVMPIVLKSNKDVKLLLVGKNPSQHLKELSSENIIVVGRVDSVESYYECSSIALVPIFSGGGVKIKLIEAASFNKIVMSTTFGLKGSMFNDSEVIVRDNHVDFANTIIDILKSKKQYEAYRKRCYDKFLAEYNLDSNMLKYQSFVESFAAIKRS